MIPWVLFFWFLFLKLLCFKYCTSWTVFLFSLISHLFVFLLWFLDDFLDIIFHHYCWIFHLCHQAFCLSQIVLYITIKSCNMFSYCFENILAFFSFYGSGCSLYLLFLYSLESFLLVNPWLFQSPVILSNSCY